MDALPISEARSREFTELTKLGAARLDLVRNRLSSCGEKFLKLEQLSEFLSAFLEQDEALRVASSAISLRRTADRLQVSVDELLDALTNGLHEAGWSKENLDNWAQILPQLRAIITDSNIELAVKTSDLYYKHRYHVHEARVITDVRPVLNDERTDLEVAIIKNTFMVEYSDGNEDDLYFEVNLSYEDLKRLRGEIERAISKTELIQRLIEKKMNVPSIIYSSEW
ncbi:hypothetical protein [Methylobacterium sp. 22177]|uniref:hypothetical protein n=1 Tax=Methylobacterium sp. 22177 TaxID=3453885 RepID=UPI003F834A38